MDIETTEEVAYKEVGDLGASAYLMMHGYKVVGRRGTAIIFEVEKDGLRLLEERTMEYLSSDFHRFDSCLMSLKKVGQFIPDRR